MNAATILNNLKSETHASNKEALGAMSPEQRAELVRSALRAGGFTMAGMAKWARDPFRMESLIKRATMEAVDSMDFSL